MINLRYITNATFERNSFLNGTRYCCPNGAALHAGHTSLLIIRLCLVIGMVVYVEEPLVVTVVVRSSTLASVVVDLSSALVVV